MDAQSFAIYAAAFLLSLSFHESAHAWTALQLGDTTGASLGRISLNPIRHIDPFGTILLPLMLWYTTHGSVMFGYAKPVPYNPYALRNPPMGSALIAGAGPLSNLFLALVAALVLGLASPGGFVFERTLGHEFLLIVLFVNIGLAVFNLLPFPPLDGGTVLAGLLPRSGRDVFARIEPYGFLILMALMYFGLLDQVTGPVTEFLSNHLLRIAQGLRG